MVSILKTDKIQASHGSTIEVPSGHVLTAPGHIIQIIQAQTNTVFSTTSTSYVDSGFAASITPKFSSSKIYVLAGINLYNNTAGGVSSSTIYRDGSRISDSATYGHSYGYNSAGAHVNQVTYTYLDSPNTTSATEYKIYISCVAATGTLKMCANNSSSTLTLMEIAQ